MNGLGTLQCQWGLTVYLMGTNAQLVLSIHLSACLNVGWSVGMDGWMDGRMDGQIYVCMYTRTVCTSTSTSRGASLHPSDIAVRTTRFGRTTSAHTVDAWTCIPAHPEPIRQPRTCLPTRTRFPASLPRRLPAPSLPDTSLPAPLFPNLSSLRSLHTPPTASCSS